MRNALYGCGCLCRYRVEGGLFRCSEGGNGERCRGYTGTNADGSKHSYQKNEYDEYGNIIGEYRTMYKDNGESYDEFTEYSDYRLFCLPQ